MVILLVSVMLQGCPFMGDPIPRTWIVEAYAPGDTVESVAAVLPNLALQVGIADLAQDHRDGWFWEEDLPPNQRRIRYAGRTILDRVNTEVIVVDLELGAGLRFVFSGDADDDDSMKVVIADLMRILTDRFGRMNVAFSPGLIQSKWQAEEKR